MINKSIFITTLIFIGFNDCMEAKRSNLMVYYSRQRIYISSIACFRIPLINSIAVVFVTLCM